MTTDIILYMILPVSLLFLLTGLVIGWVSREYMMNYREVPRPHPEMFDVNRNLVPDEIVAFRFDNYDSNENPDDED